MEIDELVVRWSDIVVTLRREIPNMIRKYGEDMRMKIYQRINQRGESATGNQFPPLKPAYAAEKKALGRDAGFRNLSLYGDMLLDFKIFNEGSEYKIGFTDAKQKAKAEKNSLYAGVNNIIEPSEKEIEILVERFNEGVLNIIKEGLGQ